jgi:CubicO group peptidase (beta-lactamase class C family)
LQALTKIEIMKSRLFKLSLFLLSLVIFYSCHVGRYFYWNYADISDWKKFSRVGVASGKHLSNFVFPKENMFLQLPEKYSDTKNSGLSSFLENHKTVAFIFIQNDTIRFEEYYSGFDESSVVPSFSVSKVFVSALAGIAVEEGYFNNTHQPVTDFVPELLHSDSLFANITLEDLLNMRSGIRFKEAYGSPFADMAKFYYGRNLKKYITRLEISSPPDVFYNYNSANTLLLAMAIERATGMPLNEYLSLKIWQPLGMEFDATMNIDSKKHNQIKAFCCLNARARDFARFGRLYLNSGNWQGKQIIPSEWVERSMTIINDSHDSQGFPYTYFWRVTSGGAIFAKGVLGQYIYLDPSKNIIIVRLGKKSAGVNWADFFQQLCDE